MTMTTKTRRTKRTDAHRPGAIVPTDYIYMMSYSLAGTEDGWPCPAIGVEAALTLCREAQGEGSAVFAVFGWLGKCGVCGACYRHGDLWRHEPTGALVHLGHDCADKYQMVADRMDYERELDGVRRAGEADRKRSAAAIARELKAERAAAWCAAQPGLAEALELDHDISRDLKAKMVQYGSLSERQIALAHKLVTDAAARVKREAERATEVMVAAPQGKRISFQGVVVGAKAVESQWGVAVKITVKVDGEGGSWLAWGTMPQGVQDDAWSDAEAAAWRAAGKDGNAKTPERICGRRVSITATLKPGREAHFALMERPNGRLLAE